MFNIKYGKLFISGSIFIFSCILYYEAGQFRQLRAIAQIGPDFWPKIILICLGFFSALAFLFDVFDKSTKKIDENTPKPQGMKNLILGIVCVFLYISFLEYFGFILLTPVFIIVFMCVLGEKRKWIIALNCVVLTAGIIVIFSKFFLLAIPRGTGIFRSFSLLFY